MRTTRPLSAVRGVAGLLRRVFRAVKAAEEDEEMSRERSVGGRAAEQPLARPGGCRHLPDDHWPTGTGTPGLGHAVRTLLNHGSRRKPAKNADLRARFQPSRRCLWLTRAHGAAFLCDRFCDSRMGSSPRADIGPLPRSGLRRFGHAGRHQESPQPRHARGGAGERGADEERDGHHMGRPGKTGAPPLEGVARPSCGFPL